MLEAIDVLKGVRILSRDARVGSDRVVAIFRSLDFKTSRPHVLSRRGRGASAIRRDSGWPGGLGSYSARWVGRLVSQRGM